MPKLAQLLPQPWGDFSWFYLRTFLPLLTVQRLENQFLEPLRLHLAGGPSSEEKQKGLLVNSFLLGLHEL